MELASFLLSAASLVVSVLAVWISVRFVRRGDKTTRIILATATKAEAEVTKVSESVAELRSITQVFPALYRATVLANNRADPRSFVLSLARDSVDSKKDVTVQHLRMLSQVRLPEKHFQDALLNLEREGDIAIERPLTPDSRIRLLSPVEPAREGMSPKPRWRDSPASEQLPNGD